MSSHTNIAPVWGNGYYLNLRQHTPATWRGHRLELIATTPRAAHLQVDATRIDLPLCRRALPTTLGNLRLFCADTRPAAALTTDTFTRSRRIHGCLTADALICLSDAARPLLPPDQFTFPISTRNTYRWHMGEASHMFAYLAANRSHEGIDFDLTNAAGSDGHTIVAMEDCRVVRVQRSHNGCAILQSSSHPNIFYTYQHLYGPDIHVDPGQHVSRGSSLGWARGDLLWPHLHLSVCHASPDAPPSLNHRYNNLLNGFPQLYEAHIGDLAPRTIQHESIDWSFGESNYGHTGNQQRCGSYTPLLGYGWELGDWCLPDRVEIVADSEPHAPERSLDGARLHTTLFQNTPAESHAPDHCFTFRIDVPPGTYTIQVTCGDPLRETNQELYANQDYLGSLALPPNQTHDTPPTTITAPNGTIRLTIRTTPGTPATLQHLNLTPKRD